MTDTNTKNDSTGGTPKRDHWGDHSTRQATAKDALTTAAIKHVVFDGFTEQALLTAAQETDTDADFALSLFPDPEADLIAWHSMLADTRMLEAFFGDYNPQELKVHERIKTLVMLRFRQNIDDRRAVRTASRILMHPRHSTLSLRLLARTCDRMWRAAGDTSTDWNFYSKRTLLGLVYTSTLPVWLKDETEDLSETEDFLLRRLQDVLKFGKWTSKFKPQTVMGNSMGDGTGDRSNCGMRMAKCLADITRPARFLRAFINNQPKRPII